MAPAPGVDAAQKNPVVAPVDLNCVNTFEQDPSSLPRAPQAKQAGAHFVPSQPPAAEPATQEATM